MASGCYVYAILGRETVLPPDLSGFGGASLTTVPWLALAAAISALEGKALEPTPDHLVQHELVVEAVRRFAPALPVRFGTLLPDADAVAHSLAEHYQVLLGDLARLGNKVELGLTVLWDPARAEEARVSAETIAPTPEPSAMAPGPGTSYLRTRLVAHRQERSLQESAQQLVREADQILRPAVLAARYAVLPTPRLALRARYLVEPAGVQACWAAFTAVERLRPDLRALGSGPWPPYSFVTPPARAEQAAPGISFAADLFGT